MGKLFNHEINNNSWEEIFQSIDAFEPLVKAIFKKHGLILDKIENLTPGTNAVFKVGDKVIKIFAPVESGYYDIDYFEIEREAQSHVNSRDVASPKLLFCGEIRDRYAFKYIIMELVKGREAGETLPTFTAAQKRDFAAQILDISNKINVKMDSATIPLLPHKSHLAGDEWKEYSKGLRDERAAVIQGIPWDNLVYVHGDMTAENMIIDENGGACLIDFADSHIAPYYYEWMPIVFGLFKCDPVMMAAYFGEYCSEQFYDKLTHSVLIHEFGALGVKELCEVKGLDIGALVDVSCLRDFLIALTPFPATQPPLASQSSV